MQFFDPSRVARVYVSSCRRGFLAVADKPGCVTSVSGASGNHMIIGIKRVIRVDGEWQYADKDIGVDWWLQKAWKEAIALVGGEPWRVYELDAAHVAAQLDAGVFTDDIRGFQSRCEPWQPMIVDDRGDFVRHAPVVDANVWERDDGWRIVRTQIGAWLTDGSRCKASRSVLKSSPQHFEPLHPSFSFGSHAGAMEHVEENRPWQ